MTIEHCARGNATRLDGMYVATRAVMIDDTLITGGAGFVGSHLCELLLKRGARVTCLDDFSTGRRENVRDFTSEKFTLIKQDVALPIDARPRAIYHLACPASPPHYQRDPVRTLRTAFEGTRSVLELARVTGARVVIASTSEVYGDPHVHPQPEHYWGNVNPIGLRSCYDEGKRAGEALAVAYRLRYGVDVRIARIFNTYGPRMDSSDGRVVSNFVVQALRSRPLTVYGDGHQTRSFCFVSDLLRGLTQLMACAHDPGPVNLGNPHEIDMLELAELVIELCESSSSIEHRPLPSDDPTRRRPDITKAKSELGWSPRVSIREGLRRTIRYFRGVPSDDSMVTTTGATVAAAIGNQQVVQAKPAT
jgi:UDP-glucuronate decarboxylase